MKKLWLIGSVLLVACGGTMDGTAGLGSGAGDGGGNGGSGSGAGGTVKPEWVSGSRLRARVDTTDDGGRAFAGWYDSMLKGPCTFQIAGDGQRRCLPTVANMASVDGEYSDDHCTIPLARELAEYATACPPSYLLRSETVTAAVCGDDGYPQPRAHIYAAGAVFTGAKVYSFLSDSTCVFTTPPTAWTYFEVGAEIPPASFATGSVVIE
jgi:hypothetical protein